MSARNYDAALAASRIQGAVTQYGATDSRVALRIAEWEETKRRAECFAELLAALQAMNKCLAAGASVAEWQSANEMACAAIARAVQS
jgi:hypothetical protein